jgi:hypothetical protein
LTSIATSAQLIAYRYELRGGFGLLGGFGVAGCTKLSP